MFSTLAPLLHFRGHLRIRVLHVVGVVIVIVGVVADADADAAADADVDADACIENGDTHYVTELDVSDDILMDDVIDVDYMTDVVAHSHEIDNSGLDHPNSDHHVHLGLVEHINSYVGHMIDNLIHC